MSLMRHPTIKFTLGILAMVSFLVLRLVSITSNTSGSGSQYHFKFLNFGLHPSQPTTMTTSTSTTTPSCPDHFILLPSTLHKQTLILLHGTSQDGFSFGSEFLSFPIHVSPNSTRPGSQILPELFPGTKFIFPTGKKRWCTVLGRESHAWFDFQSFSDRTLNEGLQIEGLKESVEFLEGLIKEEVQVMAREIQISREGRWGGEDRDEDWKEARKRIFVGGFSQGAAVSCIAFLSGALGGDRGAQIGGFVGLSGWCPFRRQIVEEIAKAEEQQPEEQQIYAEEHRFLSAVLFVRRLLGLSEYENVEGIGVPKVEVFLGHGEMDTKMLPKWGREMGELLGELVMDVSFQGYEMLGHWWNEAEMRDLVGWLNSVTGPETERKPTGST